MSMTTGASLPVPVPTPDNQGFWEACSRHELVIQRCPQCDTLRHPPRPVCSTCHSDDIDWKRVSGLGTIYTYSITHQAVHPALRDRVPWNVIMVDLDEGVRMFSHLVDCPEEKVSIGLRVEVTFEDVGEGISLPYFRPATPD